MAILFEDFHVAAQILSTYSDKDKGLIKWRIINDFGRIAGSSFKNRMDNLTDQYTERYGNEDDDEYKKYVRVILLYMFEQCHIGKKQ